jgi:hypothetical protein
LRLVGAYTYSTEYELPECVKLKPIVRKNLRERAYHKVDYYGPHTDFRVHEPNGVNLKSTLMERMFKVKHLSTGALGARIQPAPNYYNVALADFFTAFKKHTFKHHPMTWDNFVSTFRGPKRKRYDRALANLRIRGSQRVKHKVTLFLKDDLFDINAKKCAARPIQMRPPEFNILIGSYVRKIEHEVYNILRSMNGGTPCIMKGYTTDGVCQIIVDSWRYFDDPVAILTDASKFDLHVSRQAILWKHLLYLLFFNSVDGAKFQGLLNAQLDPNVTAISRDLKIVFNLLMLRSGDIDTSLTGCLLMTAIQWTFYRIVLKIDAKIIDNGDDCLVIVSQSQLDAALLRESKQADQFPGLIQQFFTNFGMQLEVENIVDRLEDISFCQCRPIELSDGTYTMIRNPLTVITKDCATKKKFQSVEQYYSWLRAIGEGGARSNHGIPILSEFYYSMHRHGFLDSKDKSRKFKGVIENEYSILRYSGKGDFTPCKPTHADEITDQSRLSFYKMTGITPDDQLYIEGYYRAAGRKRVCLTDKSQYINPPFITQVA